MKRERRIKSEDAAPEEKPLKRARKPPSQPSSSIDKGDVSSSFKKIGQKSTNTRALVDELCPDKDSWTVYTDVDGTIYDASLSLSNIGDNNNKFYYVQYLTRPFNNAVWTHWGRVGEKGQSKLEQNKSEDEARILFEKKFKEKTGLAWAKRKDAPKANKYTIIEKSYDEEPDPKRVSDDSETNEGAMPKCTLSDELQNLVRFCFDKRNIQQSMKSQNYNYKKLPLGKLSKGTIEKGYRALRDIGDVILDPKLAEDNYQMSLSAAFSDLSSTYYTIIPHDFGRKRPSPITDEAQLKAEVDLLETLGNMQFSNKILNDTESPGADQGLSIHPQNAQFSSLGLQEVTPLESASLEFDLLQNYLFHSNDGYCLNSDTTIQHIYRISRSSETSRFISSGYDPAGMKSKSVNDNRRLLWHGSRGCNFGGILSQGLRISPPEAPANGKSFGKGIYLADRASKSAAYCDPWTSGQTSLLLLCEVQLGDPSYVKSGHEYNAVESMRNKGLISAKMQTSCANDPAKWMDASVLNSELEGAKIPDCSVELPSPSGFPNEYIVFDVAQIKIRYVFMLKWKGMRQWGIY